jgi:hypothetical protein
MAAHGEVVLYQGRCGEPSCQSIFYICRHCYRGQRYCSPACRTQARRQQRRCANRRYQQSAEGRLDHRDRQREYRQQRSQARVTDQGSLSIVSPTSCGSGPARSPQRERNAVEHSRNWSELPGYGYVRCNWCGRYGRFVNPYPQYLRSR